MGGGRLGLPICTGRRATRGAAVASVIAPRRPRGPTRSPAQHIGNGDQGPAERRAVPGGGRRTAGRCRATRSIGGGEA